MMRPQRISLLIQLLTSQTTQAFPADANNNISRSLTVPILPSHGDFIAASIQYSFQGVNRIHSDGPVQCDASSPCKDNSCCNSEGKCGFTRDHCSPAPPKQCLSNCNAKAMCGKDSLGGLMRCGLNLCCSYYGWCGTEEVHCGNADPQGLTAPCQAGYGGCQQHSAPTCSRNSGTVDRRTVAYYQSWNIRKRTCQKVRPSKINTKGITHLNYAFASIDPATWQVVSSDPSDDALMREFTQLKSSTLSTWLAVGGFEFSDPGPTRTTWSDMVAQPWRRAAFIMSCIAMMEKYGFQGIDLDWEYPAADQRGGNLDDTHNFVELVREMRNAFGSKYGISSVLAPDYWYLRGTDVKAMESSVDFFGFMGYDLHGPWDADVKALGSRIRPQSDVREIEKNLLPLWYAGVDPGKINFGIPYYGRGYTVSDLGCNSMDSDCGFSGPSRPVMCTNSKGMASNREIRQLIKTQNLRPSLNKAAMIKEITWDDQWIGYDDDETIMMKKEFANSKCLGGTMIWAIDYDSESDFGGPNYGIIPKKGKGGSATFQSTKDCNDQSKWNCHHCYDDELTDLNADNVEKWHLAEGEALWDQVTKWYTEYAISINLTESNTFTEKVANYVADIKEMDCPLIAESGHCLWADCADNTHAAAGRYLLNQFATMKAFYYNWVQSILFAKSDVALKVTSLQADFAPPEKKDPSLKIILDILTMGTAFSSAFAWNKILKDIGYYQKTPENPGRPNDHGWHKDTANAAMSNSFTIGKDSLTEENVLKTRSKVESLAATIVKALEDNVRSQYDLLLSGTREGLDALTRQFRRGFWTQNRLKDVNLLDSQEMFSKIIIGQLLVPTWNLNSNVWPVIIIEDKPDSTENPMASDFSHGKRDIQQNQNATTYEESLAETGILAPASKIKDGDAAAMRIHHDGKTLWLLDGHVCPKQNLMLVGHGPQQSCGNSPLWKLPGIDKLDGVNYHGITHEDIIISSYEGYKANGNKNGFEPDLANLMDNNLDNLLQTPGFFKGIPICDYKTFKTNWWRADGALTGKSKKICSDYPCCPGLKIKPM